MTMTPPSHYVGIGASAGGLEAIEAFFDTMSPDSGLAFVLVQHLSPDYKSLMAELLSKRTAMPVRRAEDGMTVEANSVYLIPPQKNLRIFHGKLLLSQQDHSQGLNLPIDIFFRSLAEDQGEKAICIILSGTGSDGTRGVRAIKENGGMVMVQDPESARFDGMPKSAIGTGLADFTLTPQDMPEQLLSYILHPYAVQAEPSPGILSDEDGLTRIFALLRESSKVDFTFYKPNTMIRRIERRMSIHQAHELSEYVQHLERNPGEVTALYRELLIGVTNFFRDPESFEELREKYLPPLLRQTKGRELRMWVAGCSTGEEAYTLAILCREAMEELGEQRELRIFATDVDRDAIEQASSGLYTESIGADLPARLFNKYFYRQGDLLHIARHIREMVVFAQHNVIKDPPFTNIDLVSCRNLLIYLQPVLQKKVLEMFNFSLNPEGILFLGSSETVGDMADYFKPVHQKWRIYQAKGKRKQPDLLHESLSHFQPGRPAMTRLAPRGGVWRAQEEERNLDRLLQALAGDFLPIVLLINEHMDLLHVVGEAQGFLRVPIGKMVNDVSKIIAEELVIPLSTGVQKVLKQEQDISFSNIRVRSNGLNCSVTMRLRRIPQRKGQDPLIAVIIIPTVQESSLATAEEHPTYDLSKEAEQHIADLEQELQFTRENLQATIEELETSNEELQATNEELLASNEELQSTNEELQSVNEELFTVNAEYQSKITELTLVNNDQDNLLRSIEIATVFLDENMNIRRMTPKICELLDISDKDLGRPLRVRTNLFDDLDLLRIISEVMQKNLPLEQELRDRQGHWHLLRALPYRIGDNAYSGVVLTFIDTDRLKKGEEALRRKEEQARMMQVATGIGLWDWDIEHGRLEWSESIESLFGLEPGSFGGTYEAFLDCVHLEDRPLVQDAIATALTGKGGYHLRHRIVWPDGSLHEVEEIGRVLCDSSGIARRMLGTVRGIDLEASAAHMLDDKALQMKDQHQLLELIQQELQQRDSMYHKLMEAMPVPIGLASDNIINWANPALGRLTGYAPRELAGQEICCLCGKDEESDCQPCAPLFQKNSPGTVQVLWRRKDGTRIQVQLHTVPVAPGEPETGMAFLALEVASMPEGA